MALSVKKEAKSHNELTGQYSLDMVISSDYNFPVQM